MRSTQIMEGSTLLNVHDGSMCIGSCPVHKRTNHRLRTCPQWFDNATGFMYRVCPHGNFYLDPDERSWTRPTDYVAPNCPCGG